MVGFLAVAFSGGVFIGCYLTLLLIGVSPGRFFLPATTKQQTKQTVRPRVVVDPGHRRVRVP